MFRLLRARTLAVGIAICIVIVVAALAPRPQGVVADPKTWQGNFDGWSYVAVAEPDGYIYAQITFPSNTLAGLRRYAVANRLLADRLWKLGQLSMQVEVLLKRPVSMERLANLRTESGMVIKDVEGRIVSTSGERNTIDWVVTDQNDLRSPVVDRALVDISQKSGRAILSGVVSFKGTVSKKAYDKLVSDADVYMVDVTVNQIQRDVGSNIAIEKIEVTKPALFWSMEDIGLANFQ